MTDMMPKEQYNFIHEIEEWMLKATNMTDNEAYDFAFRVWQCQDFLTRYLSADVTPVVRCKDCMWRDAEEKHHCIDINRVFDQMDFCSFGERKDDE